MILKKGVGILALFLLVLTIPLASAYNGWGGYYGWSPAQLLENEWVVFSLIFLIFFSLIFYTLGKTMKENRTAAFIISAAISLFVSFAISNKTTFYGYLGAKIGSWAFIIVGLVAVAIILKSIWNIFHGTGLFASLFLIWFVLSKINPYDVLSNELRTSVILGIFNFLKGSTFLIILIVLTIGVFYGAYGVKNSNTKNKFKEFLHGEKKEEPYWPWKK
ncbi:MAG: hypothetical protein ABIG37_00865 [Nanoarchaeota archaeon]